MVGLSRKRKPPIRMRVFFIEVFHKVEAPRAIPKAVEQKVEVEFEGIDTTLVAILDRICGRWDSGYEVSWQVS